MFGVSSPNGRVWPGTLGTFSSPCLRELYVFGPGVCLFLAAMGKREGLRSEQPPIPKQMPVLRSLELQGGPPDQVMKIERAQDRITPWTRRRFLASAAVLCSAPLLAVQHSVIPSAAFDKCVEDFMKERDTPGGALAVVKDRRLVYARGYGRADRDQTLAAPPDS